MKSVAKILPQSDSILTKEEQKLMDGPA